MQLRETPAKKSSLHLDLKGPRVAKRTPNYNQYHYDSTFAYLPSSGWLYLEGLHSPPVTNKQKVAVCDLAVSPVLMLHTCKLNRQYDI